jgi:hypothetical protein
MGKLNMYFLYTDMWYMIWRYAYMILFGIEGLGWFVETKYVTKNK